MHLPDLRSHSSEPVYNVKAVVQATGVPAPTLRSWERRYGFPSPARARAGYRLYSDRDVAAIKWVRAMIEEGMAVSQAISLMRAGQPEIRVAVAPVAATLPSLVPLVADSLARFETRTVERLLSEAFALYGIEEVCQGLVAPAMWEIGDRWAAGTLSVGAEHFISNLVREKLEALRNVSAPAWRARPLVAACPAGEEHELALLMFTVLMGRRGYASVYLGANVPARDVCLAVETVRPAAVCLSVTRAEILPALREMVAALQGLREAPPIILGGRPLDGDPSIAEQVGVYYLGARLPAAADALAALASRA